MRRFVVFLLIFISFNYDEISAESDESRIDRWLNMKIKDVKEDCQRNGNDNFEIGTFAQYYSEVQHYGMVRLSPLAQMVKIDNEFDFILNIIYNTKTIESLKAIVRSIQNCLSENDRLHSSDIIQVIGQVLETHAKKMLSIGSISPFEILSCEAIKKSTFKNCAKLFPLLQREKFNEELSVLQTLIPNHVNATTCKEALPMEQCMMKEAHNCSESIKKMMQIHLTPSEHINGICENFLHDTADI